MGAEENCAQQPQWGKKWDLKTNNSRSQVANWISAPGGCQLQDLTRNQCRVPAAYLCANMPVLPLSKGIDWLSTTEKTTPIKLWRRKPCTWCTSCATSIVICILVKITYIFIVYLSSSDTLVINLLNHCNIRVTSVPTTTSQVKGSTTQYTAATIKVSKACCCCFYFFF